MHEVTAHATIHQCTLCLRFFAEGRVVSFSAGEGLSRFRAGEIESFECAQPDCQTVADARSHRDAEKRAAILSRRKARRNRVATSSSRCTPDQVHRGCPLEDHREYAAPVAPSQSEFEKSGAAQGQDARAIEFFTDKRTHGKFFSLRYLMEISGSPNFHNRAIAVRKHFEPLGLGLWNEMRPFGPTRALHSHYALLPLSEVKQRERERSDERERERGQKTFQ